VVVGIGSGNRRRRRPTTLSSASLDDDDWSVAVPPLLPPGLVAALLCLRVASFLLTATTTKQRKNADEEAATPTQQQQQHYPTEAQTNENDGYVFFNYDRAVRAASQVSDVLCVAVAVCVFLSAALRYSCRRFPASFVADLAYRYGGSNRTPRKRDNTFASSARQVQGAGAVVRFVQRFGDSLRSFAVALKTTRLSPYTAVYNNISGDDEDDDAGTFGTHSNNNSANGTATSFGRTEKLVSFLKEVVDFFFFRGTSAADERQEREPLLLAPDDTIGRTGSSRRTALPTTKERMERGSNAQSSTTVGTASASVTAFDKSV